MSMIDKNHSPGNGVSSKVYKGTLHHAPVAIKKVNRGSSKWQHAPIDIEHDSIVRLIGELKIFYDIFFDIFLIIQPDFC